MKTLALVIGNNDYLGESKLTNAVNDSTSMAEIFERLGFDTIHKMSCKINDFNVALDEFEKRIKDYDSSIFYFAGHGFQIDGENYFTSIESQIEFANKNFLQRSSIRLTEILDIVKKSETKTNIIIIDACRRTVDRGTSNSFSNLNVPKGTIIAFSTSPNQGASDFGMDGHSIYTGALLKYLGRELLSVEDLFKKVRKTVHNLTNGEQTTWEHTSLIGDFYFNNGQMVYSTKIPYEEFAIKDREFKGNGNEFSEIIDALSSCNWDRQNPAINKFLGIKPSLFNKNELFLIGRNILQCAGFAFNSTNFIDNLVNNLKPYQTAENENHLLNGILFEIYFDNNGDFRIENFKKSFFQEVIKLRNNKLFAKSFEFINDTLKQFASNLFYIPEIENNEIIDIDIFAIPKTIVNEWTSKNEQRQVIQKINVSSKDVTNHIGNYDLAGQNKEKLIEVLADYLVAPLELINLVENIELEKIFIEYEKTEEW